MRKKRSKRAVSTMVGGIIVLALFLTALVAMVVVTGAYDAYERQVAIMHRRSDDRFSEQLQVVVPGIIQNNRACPAGVTCYIMTVNNLGIGVQIARIYINSTGGGCRGLCVLDPETSPAAFKFSASDARINSGEFLHEIDFWIPSTWSASYTWPSQCTIAGSILTYGCSSVTLVTGRGGIFAFQYPIPLAGLGGKGGAGGTGLYIGPVVYTFQRPLIAYSTASQPLPQIPIGGNNGYWKLPVGEPIILYVKLQTDNGTMNNVTLTAQAILELQLYTSPGSSPPAFYVIAPITMILCQYFQSFDQTIRCLPEYGYYAGGNTGNPNQIVPYVPCPVADANGYTRTGCAGVGSRYMFPTPNATQAAQGQRGDPVVVAFGVNQICLPPSCPKNGYAPNGYSQSLSNSWAGSSALTFLGLTYAYDDEQLPGQYFYGVTLPFVAVCTYDPNSGDPAKNNCPG